jgi:orotate phosphoribosyltransferase
MINSVIYAKNLLQIKAIVINLQNLFTWASGIKSPIYCDNRIALSYPEVRSQIISSLKDISEKYLETDVIAGVATAGISWGAILADQLNKPFVYIRSQAKDHGKKNLIEGRLYEGSNVLIVEDLISTGGSSINCVDAVRELNCEVLAVISLFNYNMKQALINFQNANCKFESICDFDILIDEAKKINYLNDSEHDIIKEWKNDPENWYKNLNV